MKRTTTILAIICAMILTSCAGKFGVMKRRYNKGFYVSVSHDRMGKETSKQRDAAAAKTSVSGEKVAIQYVPAQIKPYNVQQVQPTVPAASNKGTRHVSASARSVMAVTQEKQVKALQVVGERKQADSRNGSASDDSDVALILLIILAIIIPPLAVYLKHKTIDKWFWITLVLALVGIIGVIAPFAWLAWLAAIIIAILYVLGNIG